MSKVITSPSKKWSGTVTISDPLLIPQTMAFEDAVNAAKDCGMGTAAAKYSYLLLPGVCACVEKWNLAGLPEGMTPEQFPGSPKVESIKLLAWLVNEIGALYDEAETVPNA